MAHTKKAVTKRAAAGHTKKATPKRIPNRVVLVTWVSPTKKKQIDTRAASRKFPSTAAFVRNAIEKQLR